MSDNSVKKILILAANPLDTVRLSLEREVEEIRTTLHLSANRDRFRIEPRGAVRPGELQKYMYDVKPWIVHFSGHSLGGATASDPLPARKLEVVAEHISQPEGLMFEDENGRSILVSGIVLSDLFALFKKEVVCVVLNSCYSIEQAKEIVKHISYVVCMKQAIGDLAARKFSEGFYRAIWDDRSIEEAFASGINAIDLKGIPEALTPTLLPRDLPKIAPQIDAHDISIIENNGRFYILRSRLEKRCYQEILKPGMLIRITSPDKMGKSFMMSRVLDYVKQCDYRTVIIDLREANQEIFSDINKFLQWLCAMVSDRLNIDRDPEENWKKFLGANPNCTKFFENYFLSTTDKPLVIAFYNFDCIFDHANIEADFCGLLRGWFEKANTSQVWENLRQIIVYSQESYAIKDINQSPFNVGFPVELGELNSVELLLLANAYGLSWTNNEIEQLMNSIGGHPYLAQLAFEQIVHQEISLDDLLKAASTAEGIYGDYLYERLQHLAENPLLVESMRQVVNADRPVRLGSKETFKLDSIGLIKRHGNDVTSRCNLYRVYFQDMLRE